MSREILKQLKDIKDNQVTKEYFDEKVSNLENKIKDHDQKFETIEQRLTDVESTSLNQNTLYRELYEQESCKNNVIIFNFPEQSSSISKKKQRENEHKEMMKMFADMGIISNRVKDSVKMKMFRLGKDQLQDKIRPIKIIFRNRMTKEEVMSAAYELRNNDGWEDIVITDDLTKKQRELASIMRNELLEKAATKNEQRTEKEIEDGVEWKVRGSFGRHNLRLVKVKPEIIPTDEEASNE